MSRSKYNQIANYAITESGINLAISDKAPEKYFAEIAESVAKGKAKYGELKTQKELLENLAAHGIPDDVLEIEVDFDDFLENRRLLMASLIKVYFEGLAGNA